MVHLVTNPESSSVHRKSPKSINQRLNSKFWGLSLSTRVWFLLAAWSLLFKSVLYCTHLYTQLYSTVHIQTFWTAVHNNTFWTVVHTCTFEHKCTLWFQDLVRSKDLISSNIRWKCPYLMISCYHFKSDHWSVSEWWSYSYRCYSI